MNHKKHEAKRRWERRVRKPVWRSYVLADGRIARVFGDALEQHRCQRILGVSP